jgi:hypothetical protein
LKKLLLSVGTLFVLSLPAPAGATTIPANCSTCGGHNTSFNISYVESDVANDIYQVTVTATYGSSVDFYYLSEISLKISSIKTGWYSNGTPSLLTDPTEGNSWTIGENTACSTGGGGSFCASSNTGARPGGSGSTDTWVFLLDLKHNVADLSNSTGVFGAEFTDKWGNKSGTLVNENLLYNSNGVVRLAATSVPEPASLLLLASGLTWTASRRRFRRPAR